MNDEESEGRKLMGYGLIIILTILGLAGFGIYLAIKALETI